MNTLGTTTWMYSMVDYVSTILQFGASRHFSNLGYEISLRSHAKEEFTKRAKPCSQTITDHLRSPERLVSLRDIMKE